MEKTENRNLIKGQRQTKKDRLLNALVDIGREMSQASLILAQGHKGLAEEFLTTSLGIVLKNGKQKGLEFEAGMATDIEWLREEWLTQLLRLSLANSPAVQLEKPNKLGPLQKNRERLLVFLFLVNNYSLSLLRRTFNYSDLELNQSFFRGILQLVTQTKNVSDNNEFFSAQGILLKPLRCPNNFMAHQYPWWPGVTDESLQQYYWHIGQCGDCKELDQHTTQVRDWVKKSFLDFLKRYGTTEKELSSILESATHKYLGMKGISIAKNITKNIATDIPKEIPKDISEHSPNFEDSFSIRNIKSWFTSQPTP